MITGLAEPRNSIASKLPHLWTEDYDAAQELDQCFRIALPGDEGEGQHIIALHSELEVRKLAQRIQRAGGTVQVYLCPSPLAVSIFAMGLNVAPMIVMGAIPYDQWLQSIKHEPLELEDAVALAEFIFANDPDSTERTIALDTLGRRAGVSEYNWRKNYLDVIRAQLEKTLALADTTSIDELIVQGASGSYLANQLNRIAADSHYPVAEVWKLYHQRVAELDVEGERDSNRDEVQSLLNLTAQSLDLADYLPPSLAQPITQWCEWLSIRPAVALTALLTGASSLHKVGTELVIHRNQNFRVPPTIYGSIISFSGQRKSPIFHNVIRQPLTQLRQEKVDAYQAAMADYQAAMEAWEQSSDKGAKPEKPKDATLYFFTNATGEAIPVQASKDPGKALLALIDELAGYFNSNNAYRSGRGSDKQDLLSYFDGSGQTILRAGGVRVDLPKIYLSIFGTIQPEVLKRHMDDCSDPDGNWARFLFVNQPLEAAILHDDDGMAVQISDRITDFYRRIDQLPEMEYRLSKPAFKRYQKVYNQLERLRVTHPNSGMAAVYSKMQGYIGRLALNLHVLWELDAGKQCPSPEIPLSIMEMAIGLAKFYMGQVKLIHANADDDSIPVHITKLIELSKRLEANGKDGWIKAQQYREQFDSKKRPSAQQARQWMSEAVTLGYGCTRGTGNRLEYHWLCDNSGNDTNPPSPGNLGKLREDLGKSVPVVDKIENKGVEDELGNLGKDIPISSMTNEGWCNSGEECSLEGGSVPAASLTTPSISCDVEPVVEIDLGLDLGKPFPNFPEVSLSAADGSSDADGRVEVVPTPSVEEVVTTVADEVTQPELVEGEQVIVETEIPSLKNFNGRQGVIESVKSGTCLVDFGNDEFMHIPFTGLRRISCLP